jgi:hypothetical protein
MSAYFRLAIAVRSNLPATTKDEDGLACKILYILVTPVTVSDSGHPYSHVIIRQS